MANVVFAYINADCYADRSNDRDDECAVEQVFPVIVYRPRRLTPLLPRKNVQQKSAERDDGDHQKCGGQNNISHDNVSSFVVAKIIS